MKWQATSVGPCHVCSPMDSIQLMVLSGEEKNVVATSLM